MDGTNGNLSEYDIVVLNVMFSDGIGSKSRPAILVELEDEQIGFFRITSQYENKSEAIKEKYFEIIDYIEAGLKKQSWIDTVMRYYVDDNSLRIRVIGQLTDSDMRRLEDFLAESVKL